MTPQEWLHGYASGPLALALDRAIGGSLAFDGLLHLAGAAALGVAVGRAAGSRGAAAIAAGFLALHPAAGLALASDSRGVLLGTLAGASGLALACGRDARGAWGVAGLALLAAALLCGSAAAAAFALAAGALAWGAGERRTGGFALALVALDGAARIAASSGAEPAAALHAAWLAAAPLRPGFDLTAQGIPGLVASSPGGSALAPALESAALVIALLFAVAAARAARARWTVLAWLGGAFLLAAAGGERAFLHDRASASLAPFACAGWALLLAKAGLREPRRPAPAALAAALGIVALGAFESGRRLALAADTEGYLWEARRAAPGSPLLAEALGQVVAAKARGGAMNTAERKSELREAAGILWEGAAGAAPGRRFRMRRAAVECWLGAGDVPDAQRRLPELAADAASDEARAETAILRARSLEIGADAEGALRCLEAAAAQLPGSARLQTQVWRSAVAFHGARLGEGGPRAEASRAALEELESSLRASLRSESSAPSRAAARVALGRILLARGRTVEALREFEEAKRVDPALGDAYAGAAEAYVQQSLSGGSPSLLEGAERELRAGLFATRPTPPPELLVSLAAVQLQRGGDPEAALALVDAARQADPGSPQLSRTHAAALAVLADRRLRKGDVRRAEEAALAAVAEAPDAAPAHAILARVREQQKREEEAIDSYEKAYALDPNDELREKLAALLKSSGVAAIVARDRERAVARFARLRALGARSVELGSGEDVLRDEAREAYNRGASALERKDVARAKEEMGRSLELLPENFHALYALGTIEAEEAAGDAAREDRARDLWTRALVAARREDVDLSGYALQLNLAQLHLRRRELERARELAREYLALGQGPYQAKCRALLEAADLLEK